MKTLLQVVQDFCKRQGISVPSAVVTSTDDQIVQLLALLNEGLDELAGTFQWPQLEVEASFTSTAVESQGLMETIAPGFKGLIPNTMWSTSKRLPAAGSISPQQTQAIKAYGTGSALTNFRQMGNELHFVPAIAAGQQYRFEYRTRYLVKDGTTSLPKQYFDKDTDTCILPDNLYILDLRWRWRMEKGLSYAENMATLNLVRKQAFVDSKAAMALSMAAPCTDAPPGIVVPLGSWNR